LGVPVISADAAVDSQEWLSYKGLRRPFPNFPIAERLHRLESEDTTLLRMENGQRPAFAKPAEKE